jgi:hypothetical protein
MDYENLYKQFSPLKFKLNNQYIDKLQQDQPIMMSFDENALDNLKSYLNNSMESLALKYEALYRKSHLITNLEINTLKIFLGCFIVLYLVAPKFEMLREQDELNKKNHKPNIFRIGLISLIISLFYLGYQGIDLLFEFQKIIFA